MTKQEEIRGQERERIVELVQIFRSHCLLGASLGLGQLITVIRGEQKLSDYPIWGNDPPWDKVRHTTVDDGDDGDNKVSRASEVHEAGFVSHGKGKRHYGLRHR